MRKIFVTLLVAVFLFSFVGCTQTPPDVPNQTTKNDAESTTANSTEQSTVDTTVNSTVDTTENSTVNGLRDGQFLEYIYLCSDVYFDAATPTHGSGMITLSTAQDVLEVKDRKLLLCSDECKPAAVVRLASQGAAAVYSVLPDGEFDGNFKTLKFKMAIPEPMAEDLKQQGTYDDTVARLESNYYYLLVLDETHYAYIHLVRRSGAEKAENEAALADSIIKNAEITLDLNTGK